MFECKFLSLTPFPVEIRFKGRVSRSGACPEGSRAIRIVQDIFYSPYRKTVLFFWVSAMKKMFFCYAHPRRVRWKIPTFGWEARLRLTSFSSI